MSTKETDKDTFSSRPHLSAHQHIPRDPRAQYHRATLAAGAVLWRGDPADPELALIHRPHYDDWSLAKGKVDPGESLPVTAAREIAEETGYEIRLGKLVGVVTYPVNSRTKVVYYWLGEVTGGRFVDNDEVDQLEWLPADKASELLSYEVDREILAKACDLLAQGSTTQLLLVRHARAYGRRQWLGDDDRRPLDGKGRRQSQYLAEMLAPFRPEAILSAGPDRCVNTATPLADKVGLPLEIERQLGDEAYLENPEESLARYREIIAHGGVHAIIAQGGVIPGVLHDLRDNLATDELAEALAEIEFDDDVVKKGSTWILSFTDGKLSGADYIASALPVK